MIAFRLLVSAIAASTLAACAAAPFSYSANPLEARIIDEQTREPIAGAVIVASWVLIGGIHPDRTEVLIVREAVTDEHGRFQIPAWGPVTRSAEGVLDTLDPELVVVRSGYLLRVVSNYTGTSAPGARVEKQLRDSIWNHRDIELKKNANEWRRYIGTFNGVFATLRLVYDSPDCKWKQIPRAVRALEAEREYQVAHGLKSSLAPELNSLTSNPKCQPVDQFLEAYRAAP